jgi:hypothetical protein
MAPVGFVLVITSEHLDTVIFPINNVYPYFIVSADMVDAMKLAWIGAWLTPGEE